VGPRRRDRDEADVADAPALEHNRRSSDAGGILGTYDYMAPEQRGEGDGEIDERTDLFAVGVLVYRMLTGKRLVGLAKPATKRVAHLDVAWDDLIARCLEEDPADRYPSAAGLLDDLRAAPVPDASEALLDDLRTVEAEAAPEGPEAAGVPRGAPVAAPPARPAEEPMRQAPLPPRLSAGRRPRRPWRLALVLVFIVGALGVGVAALVPRLFPEVSNQANAHGSSTAQPRSAPEIDTSWPFDSHEAQSRQRATAESLGIPIKRTLVPDGLAERRGRSR